MVTHSVTSNQQLFFEKSRPGGLVGCAVLVWLLWLLFAHEWVVQRFGAWDQDWQQAAETQQADLHWNWADGGVADSLVGAFGHGWQAQANGLMLRGPDAAVSLRMGVVQVVPQWHQYLQINAQGGTSATGLQLEFSNLSLQRFYYSPVLSVADWQQGVDLSELVWQRVEPGSEQQTPELWESLPPVQTLVLRTQQADTTTWLIDAIEIRQGRHSVIYPSVACDAGWSACHINNSMRWLRHQRQSTSSQNWLGFTAVTSLPPALWLGVAVLLVMWIWPRPLGLGFVVLSLLVYGVHVVPVMTLNPWLYGLGFVVAALLFWLKRAALRWPVNAAWPVWLGTAVLAVVLWWLGDWRIEFAHALPMYFFWALLQQLLLGPVVSSVLAARIESHWVVAALVGLMFSIIHSPNHVLMLATAVGGLCWSYSWLRYQNIYANACSHALLAVLFYQAMPAQWLGDARIGIFF